MLRQTLQLEVKRQARTTESGAARTPHFPPQRVPALSLPTDSGNRPSDSADRRVAVLRKACELARSACVNHPACLPLNRMAAEARSLVEQATARDNAPEVAGPANELDPWATAEELIVTLQSQIKVLESLRAAAAELCRICRPLLAEGQVRYEILAELARVTMEEGQGARDLREVVPMPGIVLVEWLATETDLPFAYCLGDGLLAARYLAWAHQPHELWCHRLMLAVQGTLLRDVGCLPLLPHVSQARKTNPQRAAWMMQQHPLVSAALLDNVIGIPLEIVESAAMHHERVTGSGYPRRIPARDQSRLTRLVATVTRLWELLPQQTAAGDRGLRLAEAAANLHRECLDGHWDPDYVVPLCQAADRADEAWPSPVQTMDRSFELHGEQTLLNGIHSATWSGDFDI